MQTLADLDSYGLFNAEAVRYPYPHYKAMREREPVHWSEKAQAWYFTRYGGGVQHLAVRADANSSPPIPTKVTP